MRVLGATSEGSSIEVEASYTDHDESPLTPSAATFTVYRDEESSPVQATENADIVGSRVIALVDKDNVRVGSGLLRSLYQIEIIATFPDGRALTSVQREIVTNLRSVT